jgi:hypothetical protein
VADSDIAALKSSGVSQKVIAALIVQSGALNDGGPAPGVGGCCYSLRREQNSRADRGGGERRQSRVHRAPDKNRPSRQCADVQTARTQRTVWATLGTGLMVAGNTVVHLHAERCDRSYVVRQRECFCC